MGAHADFWQVTREALDLRPGRQRNRGRRPGRTPDAALPPGWTPIPTCAPALARLRAAGCQTALLSNGAPKMLDAAIAHAGIADLLDATLSIEEVGVYKPARPRLPAPRSTGSTLSDPPRVAFVSTNGWDARGAAHFGFQVAWMNRFGQQLDRLPGEPKARDRRPGRAAGPAGTVSRARRDRPELPRAAFFPRRTGLALYYRDYPGPASGRGHAPALPGRTVAQTPRTSPTWPRAFRPGAGWSAPTYRGRGRSAYARDWRTYHPVQYLDDLRHLLVVARLPRFVAIGTSLGGCCPWAWPPACRAPWPAPC